MRPVTIPMKRTDDNNNTREYRLVPLVFKDARFQTVMAQIGKDFQTRFMKLCKRTPESDDRAWSIEVASWLAVFVARQLAAWYQALTKMGQTPEMAMGNTFTIFDGVFKEQIRGVLDGEAYTEESGLAETGEADSQVPGVAESTSAEARLSESTGFEDRKEGQAGAHSDSGTGPGADGAAGTDLRGNSTS